MQCLLERRGRGIGSERAKTSPRNGCEVSATLIQESDNLRGLRPPSLERSTAHFRIEISSRRASCCPRWAILLDLVSRTCGSGIVDSS